MPAKTVIGMYEANDPAPNNIMSKKNPWIAPDKRVVPPEFMLITVPLVAPAPGIPPNIAATALPIPCPINSLLLLCRVLVILSAITEVSKESIDPKAAKIIANSKI